MNATLSPGLAYDAVSILGFGPANAEPLPEAAPSEIVIRYGGWSLKELRECTAGKKLMRQQDWYNEQAWSTETLPHGLYRLRIPVPSSNRKTFAQQRDMLPPEEQVAPAVLVATAMLVHRLQTGEDLLKTDYARCREQVAGGSHVELCWYEGQLYVESYWGDGRFDRVWVSSVREC